MAPNCFCKNGLYFLAVRSRAPQNREAAAKRLCWLWHIYQQAGQTCSHQLLNCVPRAHPVISTSLSTASPQLCPLSPGQGAGGAQGKWMEFVQVPQHKVGEITTHSPWLCPFPSQFCCCSGCSSESGVAESTGK